MNCRIIILSLSLFCLDRTFGNPVFGMGGELVLWVQQKFPWRRFDFWSRIQPASRNRHGVGTTLSGRNLLGVIKTGHWLPNRCLDSRTNELKRACSFYREQIWTIFASHSENLWINRQLDFCFPKLEPPTLALSGKVRLFSYRYAKMDSVCAVLG